MVVAATDSANQGRSQVTGAHVRGYRCPSELGKYFCHVVAGAGDVVERGE
jgi:hypothetical protein